MVVSSKVPKHKLHGHEVSPRKASSRSRVLPSKATTRYELAKDTGSSKSSRRDLGMWQ